MTLLRQAVAIGLGWVPRLVGCLLLVAAMLKGSSTLLGQVVANTEPAWGGPWAQIALVEIEFVLGMALRLYPRHPLLRVAAMLLFSIFIVALVFMLREGRTSCSCAGGWIRISPWVALAVDFCAAGLLAAGLAFEARLRAPAVVASPVP